MIFVHLKLPSRGALRAARPLLCAWALVGCAGVPPALTGTDTDGSAVGALSFRAEAVLGGLGGGPPGAVDTDVLLTARDGAGRAVWARQLGADEPEVPVRVASAPGGGAWLTYRSGSSVVRVRFDGDGALVERAASP